MATNVFINNSQPPPQPQPPPPTVVLVQPNDWSTGICDCFDDIQICCCGFWCFPFLTCNTTSEFGEFFCLPLLDCCPQRCPPPITMGMRIAIRNRYKIQGSMTDDCLYATFLSTCSWCQMAREIKRRKKTFTVVNAQPAYIGAQQMHVMPGVVTSQPIFSAIP